MKSVTSEALYTGSAMPLFPYLAGRADLEIERIGILHVATTTFPAARKIQLVAARHAVQQVPGPFDIQQGALVYEQIGLECTAHAVAELDVGSRPARSNPVALVDAQQKTGTKESDERCRLQLVIRILDEAADLSRRFAASTPDPGVSRIAEIGTVELADAVVRKARALANGACSSLVPNHSERQLELALFSGVAIVCKSHKSPFVLDFDHI